MRDAKNEAHLRRCIVAQKVNVMEEASAESME